MSKFDLFGRRTFLRGAGVAVMLPWLETFSANSAQAFFSTDQRPQRLALIYTPNGYNQETFVPKDSSSKWELTPALQPLADFREDIVLVTGLDRQFVPGTGVHAQAGSCWLTSSAPQETLDGGFPTNITLDQIIARNIGKETLLPSLELSCNDFTDNKETKYFECISWYGPGYAANTEKNPRVVFERLFGKPELNRSKSVLDSIKSEAQDLAKLLSHDDQAKMEEYLTSIRETELRLERAEKYAKDIRQPPLNKPVGIPEK